MRGNHVLLDSRHGRITAIPCTRQPHCQRIDSGQSSPHPDEFTSKHKEQKKSEIKEFEENMKPLFVRMNEGQPVVQWPKLITFSVAVMIVTAVVVESLWYALTSHLSLAALVVAMVVGALIVIRLIVRAVTYQEQELEVGSTAGSA